MEIKENRRGRDGVGGEEGGEGGGKGSFRVLSSQ